MKGGRKNWDEHETTTTNDTPQEGRNNRRTLLITGGKLGCRPVYVTHDLNFTLSRRGATILVARPNETIEAISVDNLSSAVAAEVLGAATLPFYAKRIFLFEGERGKGFASELFYA